MNKTYITYQNPLIMAEKDTMWSYRMIQAHLLYTMRWNIRCTLCFPGQNYGSWLFTRLWSSSISWWYGSTQRAARQSRRAPMTLPTCSWNAARRCRRWRSALNAIALETSAIASTSFWLSIRTVNFKESEWTQFPLEVLINLTRSWNDIFGRSDYNSGAWKSIITCYTQ